MSAEAAAPPAKRWLRREKLLRWSLLMVSLVLAVTLAEVFCRIAFPPLAPVRFDQDVNALRTFGLEQFADLLQPDAEMFWRLPPSQSLPESAAMNFGIISNAQRIREDHDIPFQKSPGEFRVLFLGDSCTYGAGVHVRDGYVEQAEQTFREKHPGVSVEFINAGVPGYSLFQGWRYWEVEGHRFQPDLVSVCFGFNDAYPWDEMSDLEHYRDSQTIEGLRWSRLCQLSWRVLHQPSAPGPRTESRPRLTGEEFHMLLAKLHESVQRQGSDLLLISWGLRYQVLPGGQLLPEQADGPPPHQQLLHAFSDASGAPLVDLVPVVQNLCQTHSVSEVFLDEVHATALADAEVGRHVAAAVEHFYNSR